MLRMLTSVAVLLCIAGMVACTTSSAAVVIPSPAVDIPLTKAKGSETVVFAGGCFWGVQAVFEHVKGVTAATAGYSGGSDITAQYEVVSSGMTGHAESVKVTYDPSQVTYGQLLKVFFSVAHNPTQLNRQGPDVGSQYRSAVFFANDEQKRITQAYIAQLDQAKAFSRPIVTQVVPLKAFYPAEAYHQDYAVHHPDDAYIQINDLPKLDHLRQELPELYMGK